MNALFRRLAVDGIEIDSDDTDKKHDSVRDREQAGGWKAGDRQRFINARPLVDWLISDWHHKRAHMGLRNLDFEPVRQGLSFSLRQGGKWVPAEWWLDYFEINTGVTALRLSHLGADLNERLRPLLPSQTGKIADVPKENRRAGASSLTLAKQLLTEADIEKIYSNNPQWLAWEQSWSEISRA